MARFYAIIEGNRGAATRMGTPNSGIEGHIRGWNTGGRVVCNVNDQGDDEIDIYITGGSNGRFSPILICTIKGYEVEMFRSGKFNLKP